jgi:hypothetical protein
MRSTLRIASADGLTGSVPEPMETASSVRNSSIERDRPDALLSTDRFGGASRRFGGVGRCGVRVILREAMDRALAKDWVRLPLVDNQVGRRDRCGPSQDVVAPLSEGAARRERQPDQPGCGDGNRCRQAAAPVDLAA